MMLNRPLFALTCLSALATASFSVQAETLKPGLWEISTKSTFDNPEMAKAMAQMKEQMASMPPEQRKMMEEMMAKQGVSMSADHTGVVLKVCMSPDSIKNNEFMQHKKGDQCTHTVVPKSGNTTQVKFECSKPPSSGEGEMTIDSAQAYRSRMTVNSSHKGKNEQMKVESSGKWLASDCGNVKSFSPNQKK